MPLRKKAESAAKIAELYVRTTDKEDIYVRGTINSDSGTIVESTINGMLCSVLTVSGPNRTETRFTACQTSM